MKQNDNIYIVSQTKNWKLLTVPALVFTELIYGFLKSEMVDFNI